MSHNLGSEVGAWFIHLPIVPNWRSHITKISQERASTQHVLKFWKLHYFLLVISLANNGTLYFSKKWKDLLCDTLHVFSCDSSVYVHCTHSQKGYTCVCGHDGGGLGEGTLPWSTPNNCISFFCHRSFWLPTPTSDFFFVNVLTWHGLQRVSMALLSWFYMPFIGQRCQQLCKECKLFLFWDVSSLQMKTLQGLLHFYVFLPFPFFLYAS
jgi:hypothetical protein